MRKMNLNTFLFAWLGTFLFFLSFSNSVNAQCTISHNNPVPGSHLTLIGAGHSSGQTFTACESGTVTHVTFDLTGTFTNPGVGHEFRIAASPASGPTGSIAGPAVETFDVTGPQTVNITLTTPFPVVSGQTYAIEYRRVSGQLDGTDCSPCNYPGGNRYFHDGGGFFISQTTSDMNFSLTIEPNLVPTVGEWGLIVLALLLVSFGLLYATAPKLTTPTGQTISSFKFSPSQLPFDGAVYFKMWLICSLAILGIFTIAIQFFGYELTSADPFGAVISSFLVAYIGFLLYVEKPK